MNLTRNVSFAARDDNCGGILCDNNRGPVFGNWELEVYRGGGQNLWSFVEWLGFWIPGKVGETNPLTGDKIVTNYNNWNPHSESTLSEIEIWEIAYIDLNSQIALMI